ncbi:MAG: hypothetical protein Q9227_007817 [Pyrenula ochraceoflavens]
MVSKKRKIRDTEEIDLQPLSESNRDLVEMNTSTVKLDDEIPITVWAMLLYVYNLQWPAEYEQQILREMLGSSYQEAKAPRDVTVQNIVWLFDVNLYRAGDRYAVEGLAELAEERILQKAEVEGELIGLTAFIKALYELGELDKMVKIRQKVVQLYAKDIAENIGHNVVRNLVYQTPALLVDLIKALQRQHLS